MSEPEPVGIPEATGGPSGAPMHVAIIMDGNGRWARARGLPRAAGHKEGVEALRRAVDAAQEFGIQHLTVFSFSTENWRRPQAEIDALFDLLRIFVRRDLDRLHRAGVRVNILGSRAGLSDELLGLIDECMNRTKNNKAMVLNVAFNYGGRAEIVEAARRLASKAAAGEIQPEDIDETTFARSLWTADMPDPELLIRTGGEFRISNFLLWSAAYSEMIFLDIRWPDFTREHLADAIKSFQRRVRRYGGVGS
ncbi:MAG: isoprenyl transferase [Hyphomonadaceae bacterium]